MVLYTIGDLADLTGLKTHQARYLCQKHRIKPVSQAGKKFIYDGKSLERLRKVIKPSS